MRGCCCCCFSAGIQSYKGDTQVQKQPAASMFTPFPIPVSSLMLTLQAQGIMDRRLSLGLNYDSLLSGRK